MYGKELLESGIYGVKCLTLDRVVYIGSTRVAFVTRWGYHINSLERGVHCNKRLTDLFKSGDFEFVIIEAGKFTSKQLLGKEKYYTEKYDVVKNGYCINVGGGTLQPIFTRNTNFEENETIKDIRDYISSNWFNKKIYKEDRSVIEMYINSKGILKVPQFMTMIKRIGFTIQRFADKKSWLITEKTY